MDVDMRDLPRAVDETDLAAIVAFLKAAERLKDVTRNSWTSAGRRESVAEHSWRLCLMAMILGRELDGLDILRLLRMCIVHDLGEAIHGDVPAVDQRAPNAKASGERRDLLTLLEPLPDAHAREILALWDEYELGATPEARCAKALDKLETILQHNQGKNPEGFDYAFNLEYGREYVGEVDVLLGLREIVDGETRLRLGASGPPDADAHE